MFALRTWSRRWNRLVASIGVAAMLFGIGMEVHAVVMVAHDAHGHSHLAVDAQPAAHDHASGGADHVHPAPDAGSGHSPDPVSDEGPGIACCSAVLCPPMASVLPTDPGEPLDDCHLGPAPGARIAGLTGVGHTPLLRPPR